MKEESRRDEVLTRVLDYIRRDETIRLPRFDPSQSAAASALLSIPDNDFSGHFGPFRYQFEGEDDLLHVIVIRADGQPLTPEDARPVASFVLPGVLPALIWLKPGQYSQHFYLGHDDLLAAHA